MAATAKSVANVTVHDLYQHYPNFFIDIHAEQDLLRAHDIVFFQHPLYWYSCPALLKEWMDLVLEHDFAYGKKGNALKGKFLGSMITTGGSEASYQSKGQHQYSLPDFLLPFQQTAHLCGMNWLQPLNLSGTHTLTEPQITLALSNWRRLLDGLASQEVDPFDLMHSPEKTQDLLHLADGATAWLPKAC